MGNHLDSLRNYLTVEDTFEGYFGNIEFWLNLLGMNIFDKKWIHKSPKSIQFRCIIFVSLLFMSSVFAFYCGLATYKDSLEDQLSSYLASCFAIEVAAKTGILFYKRKSFQRMKDLVSQYIREGKNGTDMEYQPILVKYENWTMYFYHWLVKMYIIAVIVLCTVPFIMPREWIYPTNFVIPGISVNSYPGYAINYSWISFGCVLATIFFIGFDCYIVLLSLVLASRFEHCATHFSKVGLKETNNEKELIINGLKLHSNTMDFYLLCQQTMEPTVLAELLAVIAIISLEMLIFLMNPYSQSCFTFLSTITQVFFHCGCSEFVAIKASDVAKQLYNSEWYNVEDEKLKKLLIIVLNRSQKPCYFSVGPFLMMSMETFAKISSISFKSFNCIRSMV